MATRSEGKGRFESCSVGKSREFRELGIQRAPGVEWSLFPDVIIRIQLWIWLSAAYTFTRTDLDWLDGKKSEKTDWRVGLHWSFTWTGLKCGNESKHKLGVQTVKQQGKTWLSSAFCRFLKSLRWSLPTAEIAGKFENRMARQSQTFCKHTKFAMFQIEPDQTVKWLICMN